MKLMLFGATGGIGHQVVEQALEAGHYVTALARRPEAITVAHPHLEVVKGDVFEPTTFNHAVAGKDAVISALGVRDTGPTRVYSQGLTNIIAAMRAAKVSRLICVSASGLEPGVWWQRWAAKAILWRLFRESYTDLSRMEAIVKASNLDWTILRPARLTDGQHTGRYQMAINKHLSSGWRISRADVADSILHQIDNVAAYCGVIEVAY